MDQMMDQGEQGAQGGDQGGLPPEAIDAALTVLMMMAKAGGPNADLFTQAFQALQGEIKGGGEPPPGQAVPAQAGGNPNAVPLR